MSYGEPAQNITTAVTEISDRALQLVHEEIELAKAEVSEKVTRLLTGTVVGIAAGVFILAALQFVLIGLALLAWWAIPWIGATEFFWGFFIVAGGLVLLAALAGGLAARAVRAGSPPVPSMALEEARKIRESVNAGPEIPGASGDVSELPTWGEPIGSGEAPRGPAAGAQAKAP
jgi:uncharacterized membrane protein YqjE